MTWQTLFKPPPADGNLTPRQQAVYDLLRQNPKGIRSLDAGTALHADCGWCEPERPCKYAATDGADVLKALRARGLVVRRKTGAWQLQRPEIAAQNDPIPF